MTQDQFNEIFIKAKKQITPKSEEEALQRLSKYVKDINHITLEELAVFLQMESIKYTNDLVSILFSECVVQK